MLVNLYERLKLSPFATAEEIRAVLDKYEARITKQEQRDQVAQVRRLLLTPANREQYDKRLFEQYPELKKQPATAPAKAKTCCPAGKGTAYPRQNHQRRIQSQTALPCRTRPQGCAVVQ